MLERKTITIEEWLTAPGLFKAKSAWMDVSQAMISEFAHATRDEQFIHVDPERAARETPFGGTIAHGFLSLSLLSAMAYEALPSIDGTVMGINYGFDRIRFIQPVRAGSRIRGSFALLSAERRSPAEILSRHAVTVAIEGMDKPALAAEWLTLAIIGN